MPWDPERYRRFKDERFAPFDDLMTMVGVRHSGMSVVDLGCGTGELTRRLGDALDGADVVGIDNSAEMLAEAAAFARPGVSFEQGDLATVEGTWDLVISNAAIQWVDDHEALVPRLFGLTTPGGRLAVQLPMNHHHPAHQAIRETADDEPYAEALHGWQRTWPQLSTERYGEILWNLGGTDIALFDRVYCHELADAAAIVDWIRGTAMLPYLDRLPGELHESFVADVTCRVAKVCPGAPVLFAFRRTFFAATRPSPA